jgi:hypothetical protein
MGHENRITELGVCGRLCFEVQDGGDAAVITVDLWGGRCSAEVVVCWLVSRLVPSRPRIRVPLLVLKFLSLFSPAMKYCPKYAKPRVGGRVSLSDLHSLCQRGSLLCVYAICMHCPLCVGRDLTFEASRPDSYGGGRERSRDSASASIQQGKADECSVNTSDH